METRNMIWAAVGMVIGAVIGAVTMHRHAERKFEIMLEEEIDSYREYCRNKYAGDATKDEKSESVVSDEEENDTVNIKDIPQSVLDSAAAMRANSKAKTSYNKISKKYDTRPERKEVKEPVAIDPDEYDSNSAYLETHLFYDPTRCEAWKDNGETIDDVDAVLGFSNLEEMDKRSVDIVYIRNDELKTIFVVEREVNDDPFV